MAGSKVVVLLFAIAAVSGLPRSNPKFDWPVDRPIWWPLPDWPPVLPEIFPPSRPEWLPEGEITWPIDRPDFWPDSLPWPPALPDSWPNRPSFWPDSLPWPPALPDSWPNRPSFWPDSLPWPPALPDSWPDRPSFWPESLPWPPARPQGWPERPSWWPAGLSWPPSLSDIENTDIFQTYQPERDNEFHLFTRANPGVSQPLLINNEGLIQASNYDSSKPTIVIIHDLREHAISSGNVILIPAILAAADVNIIAVDWSRGAFFSDIISTFHSIRSGNFVAKFINFLVGSNGDLEKFHLIGVGLGGLNAGFIGLKLNRQVGYITALDPATHDIFFQILPSLSPNVARYTEVIHTDARQRGHIKQLGHVDFYPNGGLYQPGCFGDSACNRLRAVYFFAESLQTGGFTGISCPNWYAAMYGNCHGPEQLKMGGLEPKTGTRGIFYLQTNAMPPFSRG